MEGRLENDRVLAGGARARLSIHQLDELLFARPCVRAFTAVLEDRERPILRLTVESDDRLDPAALAAELPPGLALEVRYGEADPFAHRGKRKLGSGP